MRAVVNVLAWFVYKLFFFLSSIRSHVIAEIHISRREPFLNSVTVSAALVTDVLKLIYLFSRFSLYSKALNLFDNSTTCAIESSFNFLILNGFAGDFFVIFLTLCGLSHSVMSGHFHNWLLEKCKHLVLTIANYY